MSRSSANWLPGTTKTSCRYVAQTQIVKPILIVSQCSIPAFEGLFPEEDDRSINKLLFLLATWHAYAKLRLHTDTTLRMFETVCKSLCHALRHFAYEVCPKYATKELPREVNARVARQQVQAKRGARASKPSKSSKVKKFNMLTYKLHCLPDYPDAIRRYGTTDSYSTQTVRSVRLVCPRF
jgi:hypothetical protein